MNKLLMHVCCAPCLCAPLQYLRENEEIELTGFWYNHNIHPFTEYQKRKEALLNFTRNEGLNLIIEDKYELEEFLRKAAFRENKRCFFCYYDRLRETALRASQDGFDMFSTTLLYSKYQNHQKIREIGESLAEEFHLVFYYHDFRELWQKGIQLSKEQGIYRQQYCGCIYSEKERYLGK